MEEYQLIPLSLIEKFTVQWVKTVKKIVNTHGAPFLRVFEEDCGKMGMDSVDFEMIGDVCSIISVVIYIPEHDSMRQLTFDECKELHRLLTLPSSNVTETISCLIGQPVKLSDNGFSVVRIALGADMVVRGLLNSKQTEFNNITFQKIIEDDIRVVKKMAFLACNWESNADKNTMKVMDNNLIENRLRKLDNNLLISKFSFNFLKESRLTAGVASQVLSQLFCRFFPLLNMKYFVEIFLYN
jgi:hypothetical protein